MKTVLIFSLTLVVASALPAVKEENGTKAETSAFGVLDKIPGLGTLLEKLEPIVRETKTIQGYIVEMVSKLKLMKLSIYPAPTQITTPTMEATTILSTTRPMTKGEVALLVGDYCRLGKIEAVKQSIKEFGKEAVFNARDVDTEFSEYCLEKASINHRWDLVEYLADEGIDVNQCSDSGLTPIFDAPTNLTAKLISLGADVNAQSIDSTKTVLTASTCNIDTLNPEKVELLLAAGALVDMKDSQGTPLGCTLSNCSAWYCFDQALKIITTLIKYGANIKEAANYDEYAKWSLERQDVQDAIAEGHRLAGEMSTTWTTWTTGTTESWTTSGF